jgi:hypothetical protein
LDKDAAMTAHRYAVGERVLYTQHRFPYMTWKAPYMITGCLPLEGIEPQYRIRSAHAADERMAGEHELTRMGLPTQAFRSHEIPSPLDYFTANDAANLNLIPSADLPRRVWHKNERSSGSEHA